MKLSEHFDSDEFLCRCGCGYGGNPGDVSALLVDLLERIRSGVGHPLTVVSGARCPKHNITVGGAHNSSHMRGMAADILVAGGSRRFLLVRTAFAEGALGIGVGSSFVHLDMDSEVPRPAMWVYSQEVDGAN